MYGNEKGVGEAVRDSGLDRGEVFVTSKVNNNRLDRDEMLPRSTRAWPPWASTTSTCSSSTGRCRP